MLPLHSSFGQPFLSRLTVPPPLPAATLGFGHDPVKLFAQIGETFGGKVFNQTSDNLSGSLNITFGIKAQIR